MWFNAGVGEMPSLQRAPSRTAPDAADAASVDRVAYRPDLDGLRAIAVALVILTHAKWPWPNNGGDTGVTAFFVLSGFLITNLLVNQQERQGRIHVLAFYRRRVVRLGLALLGVLAFTLALGLATGWGPGRDWQLGIVSSLAYVSNWVEVGNINIDPLGHTWSLAIEEQFYLFWPAVLILLRGRPLLFAIVAIIAVSLIRIVATGPFEYFSTAARVDAILVGCVLALIGARWSRWYAVAGLAALVAVSFLDLSHDIAIPAAIVATAAIIGGRLEPLGRLAPAGLRAYSLYLWNWPMTILFGSVALVAPLMTIVVAELSFRLLEAPFLHRGKAARPSVTVVPKDPVASPGQTDLLTAER